MWSLQVLVYHDVLGMMQHPHYVKVTPKFCKPYAAIGQVCAGLDPRVLDNDLLAKWYLA